MTSCLWELTLPFTAFLLIVLAAFAHSTWNLLAKRASHNTHFIWFSSVSEGALLLPLAIWTLADSWPQLSSKAAIFLFATGILHLLYAESLLRGYRIGDLSVVYPLARGTGPLLSFFGAILALGERPSMVAGAGALLVTSGILVVSGGASIHKIDGPDRVGVPSLGSSSPVTRWWTAILLRHFCSRRSWWNTLVTCFARSCCPVAHGASEPLSWPNTDFAGGKHLESRSSHRRDTSLCSLRCEELLSAMLPRHARCP
jgi:uncharacterized membrane protein